MSKTGVYVGNLDFHVSTEELKDHMQKAGDVKFVDAPKNAKGLSKGYAIVEYAKAEDASHAIDTLNNTQVGERLIFLREDRDVDEKGGKKGGKGKGKDREGGYGKGDRKGGKGYDDRDGYGKGDRKGGKGKMQVGPEDEGKVLYVGNLSFEAAWQDVKDHFNYVGKVTRVEIAKGNGKSKGYGRVLMEDRRDAEKAIDDLHDTEFQGRKLVVRMDKFV